jgi:two-component system chemotaxis response regulator CheB
MIRILIADDSALMRNILSDILGTEPEFEVIATAKNGREVIKLNEELSPDLITMDIEMPIMTGIEATKIIMEKKPTKIVIVSAFGASDAMPTLQALKNGAIEVIQKPTGVISRNIRSIKDQLIYTLKKISKISIEKVNKINKEKIRKIEISKRGVSGKCIVIGASTGGPKALEKLLPSFSSSIDAYFFIIQHMPQTFTKSFAERLNRISDITVQEVKKSEILLPNIVYIGKGDSHFKIRVSDKKIISNLTKEPQLWGVRPCVDYLFDSAAQIFKNNILGIVLTGMGRDGTYGSKAIKDLGGMVVSQNKESAFIWGMPGSVTKAGYSDMQVSLSEIPDIIEKFVEERNE